jgi:hypothetical protein
MRISTLSLAALAILVGCSSIPEPRKASARDLPPWPEAPSARLAKPSPARSSPVALTDANEAVWHLRAGLNVAALMCKGKGQVPVSGDYSRLLTQHRGLFAVAYAAEQKRYGGGLDRHQTGLYNRYANQRDPAGFCRNAAGVAKRAAAMDSPSLARSAGSLVGALD